jgi:hypothetical protein
MFIPQCLTMSGLCNCTSYSTNGSTIGVARLQFVRTMRRIFSNLYRVKSKINLLQRSYVRNCPLYRRYISYNTAYVSTVFSNSIFRFSFEWHILRLWFGYGKKTQFSMCTCKNKPIWNGHMSRHFRIPSRASLTVRLVLPPICILAMLRTTLKVFKNRSQLHVYGCDIRTPDHINKNSYRFAGSVYNCWGGELCGRSGRRGGGGGHKKY